MKRGPDDITPIDDVTLKKQKMPITKSLVELLIEVRAGNYDNFREFLVQENIQELKLSHGQAEGLNLTNLGKALECTQVHTLILSCNDISADGAQKLAKALVNTQVHTLDLSGNNIGADGAQKLGEALIGTQVDRLYLWGNNIGADGAEKLGKALIGSKIRLLDLSNNNIGADGAEKLGKALAGTQVHTLFLSNNDIGDNGAVKLGKTLVGTQIHSLVISDNNIDDDGAEELVKILADTKVHTLDLSGNDISDDAAEKFAAHISSTMLLELTFSHYYESASLNLALKKNHWEKRLTPYYIASLQNLPENEKKQYLDLPKLENESLGAGALPNAGAQNELKFAAEIFILLGTQKFGLTELQQKILSHLPTVSPTLANQYQLATQQVAAKKADKAVSNIDVEVNNLKQYQP